MNEENDNLQDYFSVEMILGPNSHDTGAEFQFWSVAQIIVESGWMLHIQTFILGPQ